MVEKEEPLPGAAKTLRENIPSAATTLAAAQLTPAAPSLIFGGAPFVLCVLVVVGGPVFWG